MDVKYSLLYLAILTCLHEQPWEVICLRGLPRATFFQHPNARHCLQRPYLARGWLAVVVRDLGWVA